MRLETLEWPLGWECLLELYEEEERSIGEIASWCGVSTATIWKYLKKFGIRIRTRREGRNTHLWGLRKSVEMSQKWKDPNWKNKWINTRMRTLSDPNYRKKMSNTTKNLWCSQEYRDKVSKAHKALWADPGSAYNSSERASKMSESQKLLYYHNIGFNYNVNHACLSLVAHKSSSDLELLKKRKAEISKTCGAKATIINVPGMFRGPGFRLVYSGRDAWIVAQWVGWFDTEDGQIFLEIYDRLSPFREKLRGAEDHTVIFKNDKQKVSVDITTGVP